MDSKEFYRIDTKNNKIILFISIKSNSSINQILGVVDGRLKVSVTAPAVDGKANVMLIKYLARQLKIGVSEIKILKGLQSPQKMLVLPSYILNQLLQIITIV
jgi:uncharacterized protein (TIGR00251 family)